MGGLPGALVELPATTAFLLRSIQGVAAEEGFDPEADGVRFDCIRVFAAAGPLAADDGADLGFLSLRLGLTGGAVQKLIAQVAPRLSVVLGQKLAAQAVPVLGAVAGATTNFVYAGYYQEMARVHFGLRRLAVAADQPHARLMRQRLREEMQVEFVIVSGAVHILDGVRVTRSAQAAVRIAVALAEDGIIPREEAIMLAMPPS